MRKHTLKCRRMRTPKNLVGAIKSNSGISTCQEDELSIDDAKVAASRLALRCIVAAKNEVQVLGAIVHTMPGLQPPIEAGFLVLCCCLDGGRLGLAPLCT